MSPARPPAARRPAVLLLLLVLVLPACAAWLAPAGPGEPLAADPALVTGRLDNGLTYVIRPHAHPPGRLALWLHVAAGSLHETDETRGLAHYLEHMAFNGSAHFPPGSLVPFFQSLGMTFGRDQNAFTGFDQTVFTLALPDTGPDTLDRGLLYLSDVAFRLTLSPEEIDRERGIILEEKRARAGPQQRVQEAVVGQLAPESVLGRRFPIGTDATIRALGPAHFRDFYRRWYVPANMTLIAVGDVEPPALAAAIARHFGTGPPSSRPRPPDAGVAPTRGARAVVVTDPGLAHAEVWLARLEPAGPPVTTVAAYRRRLVEQLGPWILRRRLQTALAEGRVAVVAGDTAADRWAGAARLAHVRLTAPPDRWPAAVGDLARLIQEARLHGFTAAELEEARAALLARAEQETAQEATVPARQLLRRINDAVARREPILSAAQELALLRRLLPDITAAEVSGAFGADFDPDHAVLVLALPAGGSVPGAPELAALGRSAFAHRPPPPAERARPSALLAAPPPAGRLVEEGVHEPTGVWSAWLDNGLRVHHRRVEVPRDRATVVITLAGGEIEEGAGTRGVTDAARAAWEQPATSRLTSTDVRRLMAGRRVTVHARSDPDTLTLTVTGDPAELEPGLQLAHLMLTDPVVEPGTFARWRERTLREVAERGREPRGVLVELQAEAFYPAAEVRLRPLTAGQVERLTVAMTQAWLGELIRRAPVEVAVVGDIERAAAGRLVARYLGSLPARPRIGDRTLRELRAVPRPAGPLRLERVVATTTEQAQVLDGFFATDVQQVRDSRLLQLAARILTTRMTRVIREERQLVYSIGARLQPAHAFPGFGILAARAPTDPARAGALADAVAEMFAAFAAQGPTPEELEVARRQVLTVLEEERRRPEFWMGWLAIMDYRGLSLDDLARVMADYAGFTADQVREAFARYARPEARFRLVVRPRAGG